MTTKNQKSGQEAEKVPDCFVIMPIAEIEEYGPGHFNTVYQDIISVACRNAGYNPVRADDVKNTNLIHLDILQKLIESPMAICDLSGRNPNVLFELGLRQAFDKPTVLIKDIGTKDIFDIAPLRYTNYRRELLYREVIEDQKALTNSIKETEVATKAGKGVNSIVKLLSLTAPAKLEERAVDDTSSMLQVIMSELNAIRSDIRKSDSPAWFKSRTGIVNSSLRSTELQDKFIKMDSLLARIKHQFIQTGDEHKVLIFKYYDEMQKIKNSINPELLNQGQKGLLEGMMTESDAIYYTLKNRS